MKILLLGANGRTGREILNHTLSRGDSVTGVVRAEDRLSDVSHHGLEVRIGNVCDSIFLDSILPGHDVVISTLGPRKPTKAACTIYSKSAVAIVVSMEKCGVRRLLVSSTALLFPSRKFSDRILRLIAKNNYQQASLMEDRIRASSLDWTIVRTGFLTNHDTTKYRQAIDEFPEGGGSISRKALASFFSKNAKTSDLICQIVGLCE